MTSTGARTLEARHGVRIADAAALGPGELELLAEETGRRLAHASATDILTWAALTFGEKLVVASSMADGVVAHLAARVQPGVAVVFLDTGLHFPETIGTRRALEAALDIRVIDARPRLDLAEQEQRHGQALWATDPDRCCDLRKVQPLAQALAPYRAWVSGIRGEETAARANVPVVHWDSARAMVKVNPIARWSRPDVDAYAERHGVLVNPLRQLGYASIGCAPCTRPVDAGEDDRAGRWSGLHKVECGIHR